MLDLQEKLKQIKAEADRIKSMLNKSTVMGIQVQTKHLETASGKKCLLISNNDEYTLVIPNSVKDLNGQDSENLIFTNQIQGLTGRLRVVGGSGLGSISHMFDSCEFDSIDFTLFDTSKVKYMDRVFAWSKIKDMGLNNLDTSNTEIMSHMFYNTNVDKIDISSFDTSKVKMMDYLFCGSSAYEVIVGNINVSNVTDMEYMFAGLRLEKPLCLDSFDTSNVKYMRNMFCDTSIEKLDLSNFNTINVEDMCDMFESSNINTLNISHFNTKNCKSMQNMFKDSVFINDVDLTSFDIYSVSTLEEMFCNCNAPFINLSTFKLNKKHSRYRNMFKGSNINAEIDDDVLLQVYISENNYN